jgi:putative transcriptional regulator
MLITLVVELKKFKMNRIKEVLEQKGIKQIWLAEQLGKSYNMVHSYAQNKRQPSLEDLYKIAEILNIGAKELLIERTEFDK